MLVTRRSCVTMGVLIAVLLMATATLLSARAVDAIEARPDRDMFKVLIVRKAPPPPRPFPVETSKVAKKPTLPPLNVKVTAIAGEADHYVAVIRFKGTGFIVEAGWRHPKGEFEVKSISEGGVEVVDGRKGAEGKNPIGIAY